MMRPIERLASAFVGRRLELLRLKRNLTAKDMAAKIGIHPDSYRRRELGLHPISVDFLLRCHLVLGPDSLERLWFPVAEALPWVDAINLRIHIAGWAMQDRPATLEQVVEACAEGFGVPVGAVKGGSGHEKVRQARAAAVVIVSARPWLHLSELAPLVGRARRTLFVIRSKALQDESLLRRVQEIQREVDAL